jgi:putrescine carbamoyltransferase
MRKDFISLEEFNSHELTTIIEMIAVMKEAYRKRQVPNFLDKKTLTMLFLEPSLRTRMSFEVAMNSLGGNGLYIRPGDIHLGNREDLKDTAIVIGRLCDGVVIRSSKYQDIFDFAHYTSVPVINGMADDKNHPTQALNDIFTICERVKDLKGINLAFVGDTSDGFGVMGRDLMLISSKLGINFYCASPSNFMVEESYLQMIKKNAEISGAKIIVTDEPAEALEKADFLTCDAITWHGFEDETDTRLQTFIPKYQITAELLAKAPDHCKFLHCLPARRGEEVTAEVIDGEQSIVYDQAENRLYTELALCFSFIGRPGNLEQFENAELAGPFVQSLVDLFDRFRNSA